MNLNYLTGLIHKEDLREQFARLQRTGFVRWAGNVASAVAVGVVLGVILVYTRKLPSRWAGLIILATMAPTVLLLINDLRNVLLIALVVDIVLGLDIAVAETGGHIGASSGFMVSLMTMVLAGGYAHWIANRPVGGKSKIYTHKDITLPALIYLFALLLSTFQSVNVWLSVTQLFMEVQFVLMYFYIINHLKNWDSARVMFSTVVVALLFESAIMVLQHFTSFRFSALGVRSWVTGSRIASASSRAAGTIGGANAAATVVAALLMLAFAAYLTDGRLASKKLALVALFLGVPALVLTQSRSAWTAFVVGISLVVFQSLRRGKGKKAILLLLVAGLLIGIGFREVIVERLTTDDRGSGASRGWYNELAFNIIRKYPFTGIGLNNLWLVERDYLPLELMRLGEEYLYIIHNQYLLVWTETGLLGFLSFLWLLLAACRRAVKSLLHTRDAYDSIVVAGLLAALVVCLIHMLTDPFTSRPRMELLWLIIALIASITRLTRRRDSGRSPCHI